MADHDKPAPGLEPGECHTVTWEIDAAGDMLPAAEAVRVWREHFRRGFDQPTSDDACVFHVTVYNDKTGDYDAVEIDLADPRYAHLFTTEGA